MDSDLSSGSITDELHRKILQAVADPGHFLKRGGDYTEPIPEWSARAVAHVLDEWMAGRTVVHLPEPDEAPQRRGNIASWCPATWDITAHLDINGDPLVDDDDRMLTANSAERHGLALIAAAHAARRYAADHPASASGVGGGV